MCKRILNISQHPLIIKESSQRNCFNRSFARDKFVVISLPLTPTRLQTRYLITSTCRTGTAATAIQCCEMCALLQASRAHGPNNTHDPNKYGGTTKRQQDTMCMRNETPTTTESTTVFALQARCCSIYSRCCQAPASTAPA